MQRVRLFGSRHPQEEPVVGMPALPRDADADAAATSTATSTATSGAVARMAGVLTAAGPTVVASAADVPAAIVAGLAGYLDPPGAGLPAPSVAVVQVSDRTVGLGHLRGTDRAGPFAAIELRGGRIDAVVRFRVFGADPGATDDAMLALQGRLLGARDDLWDAGFLTMQGTAGSLAAQEQGAWARTADYTVLFEYELAPTAGAESLIATIPIRADQEVAGSLAGETTTVTDAITRWDDIDAPVLVLRGMQTVDAFASAAYVPGVAPTGAVRLRRTHDGASGAPNSYPTLAAFLAAVSDPTAPERHGEVEFATVSDFLAAFDPSTNSLLLGDWDVDGSPDEYGVGVLALDPPVRLRTARDRLELSLETSPLDAVAVVYVRAASTIG
jgi:hypothetical protein